MLSPKSRKQYVGLYIKLKVEIKILLGQTTNIQARLGVVSQRRTVLRFMKNCPKFNFQRHHAIFAGTDRS
jgi:hypothetical protein